MGASAPVDGTTSDAAAVNPVVSVGELVTVVVTPRDAAGDVLGRGLAMQVDLSGFADVALVGGVQDLGTGDYRLTLSSTATCFSNLHKACSLARCA